MSKIVQLAEERTARLEQQREKQRAVIRRGYPQHDLPTFQDENWDWLDTFVEEQL